MCVSINIWAQGLASQHRRLPRIEVVCNSSSGCCCVCACSFNLLFGFVCLLKSSSPAPQPLPFLCRFSYWHVCLCFYDCLQLHNLYVSGSGFSCCVCVYVAVSCSNSTTSMCQVQVCFFCVSWCDLVSSSTTSRFGIFRSLIVCVCLCLRDLSPAPQTLCFVHVLVSISTISMF